MGVLGRDKDKPFDEVVVFLFVKLEGMLPVLNDIGVRRVGILDGVESSLKIQVRTCTITSCRKVLPVLSRDKLEPCLDGGLLLGRLPVRDAGLELGLEPPGVIEDL